MREKDRAIQAARASRRQAQSATTAAEARRHLEEMVQSLRQAGEKADYIGFIDEDVRRLLRCSIEEAAELLRGSGK